MRRRFLILFVVFALIALLPTAVIFAARPEEPGKSGDDHGPPFAPPGGPPPSPPGNPSPPGRTRPAAGSENPGRRTRGQATRPTTPPARVSTLTASEREALTASLASLIRDLQNFAVRLAAREALPPPNLAALQGPEPTRGLQLLASLESVVGPGMLGAAVTGIFTLAGTLLAAGWNFVRIRLRKK